MLIPLAIFGTKSTYILLYRHLLESTIRNNEYAHISYPWMNSIDFSIFYPCESAITNYCTGWILKNNVHNTKMDILQRRIFHFFVTNGLTPTKRNNAQTIFGHLLLSIPLEPPQYRTNIYDKLPSNKRNAINKRVFYWWICIVALVHIHVWSTLSIGLWFNEKHKSNPIKYKLWLVWLSEG